MVTRAYQSQKCTLKSSLIEPRQIKDLEISFLETMQAAWTLHDLFQSVPVAVLNFGFIIKQHNNLYHHYIDIHLHEICIQPVTMNYSDLYCWQSFYISKKNWNERHLKRVYGSKHAYNNFIRSCIRLQTINFRIGIAGYLVRIVLAT